MMGFAVIPFSYIWHAGLSVQRPKRRSVLGETVVTIQLELPTISGASKHLVLYCGAS